MDKLYVLFALQICLLYSFGEKVQYKNIIKANKVECDINPEFAVNVSCKVKVVGREKYEVSADFFVIKPIKNVTANLRFFKFVNGYKPFLLSARVNACNVMAGRERNPTIAAFLPLVLRYTNINHTCPFYGHVYVRKGDINSGFLKSVVPEGKYKVELKVYENYPTIVGTMLFFATVTEVPVY